MGSTSGGDDKGDNDRDRAAQPDEDLLDTSWLDEAFVSAAPVAEKTADERIEERRRFDEGRRQRERYEASARARLRSATRPHYRSATYAIAALVVLTMALAGVYIGTHARQTRATSPATTSIDPRPYTVTGQDVTYERTADDGTTRTLPTELWVPAGRGPFPIIAFAHGNDGNPKKFHAIFDTWAKAGYAVVAPRFPVSADDANRSLEDAIADVPQQDHDLEFVVAKAVEDDRRAVTSTRPARLDSGRVAVAGLSLGGGTALQVSYTECCPGLKPKLVMAFSPVPFPTTPTTDAPPLLLIHGTGDRTLPYQGSVDLFTKAPNRRWFVTLENGTHSEPYEDSVSPFDQLVSDVTTDFLDQFLGGDRKGVERAVLAIAASAAPAHVQSAP